VIGISNRIDENNTTGNDVGIQFYNTGNIVVRNTASGNPSGNYQFNPSGNTVGPILGVANPITSENPWANFSY
jgi:parallel beta-helix repeat protein